MEKDNVGDMKKMPFGERNTIEPKKHNINKIKMGLCALFVIYFIIKFDYKDFILMEDKYSTQLECYSSHCFIKKEVFDNFEYYIDICQ